MHRSQENYKLVRRLEEIAKSKSERFGELPMLKKVRKSASVVTGSLNYNSRKQENDRIYKEN